jgi:hypothetical protein
VRTVGTGNTRQKSAEGTLGRVAKRVERNRVNQLLELIEQ